MVVISFIVTAIGFVSMFGVAVMGGPEVVMQLAMFILFAGLALMAFARYQQSAMNEAILRESEAQIPISFLISKVFWLVLSVALLVQGVSELIGFPVIKY